LCCGWGNPARKRRDAVISQAHGTDPEQQNDQQEP